MESYSKVNTIGGDRIPAIECGDKVMNEISIGRWVLGGALIGALATTISNGGLPYDSVVQNLSFLGGGAAGGGLIGGLVAVTRNATRKK